MEGVKAHSGRRAIDAGQNHISMLQNMLQQAHGTNGLFARSHGVVNCCLGLVQSRPSGSYRGGLCFTGVLNFEEVYARRMDSAISPSRDSSLHLWGVSKIGHTPSV